MMYIPKHFLVEDQEQIDQFIHHNNFAQLVSMVDGQLFATHLPFLYLPDEAKLLGHIARVNPQGQALNTQQVLVIFAGPHDYVSPNWYLDPGVPTWNYQAVHVQGVATTSSDPAQLTSIVTALTDQHESGFDDPWMPQAESGKIRGIIGIEIAITQMQCKFKLSQNRSAMERQRVAENLRLRGNDALAAAMEAIDEE